MKILSLMVFAVFLGDTAVLANESDFETRMYGYSVKRASDIDVVTEEKATEIRLKRLFREEFRKHVLATMAQHIKEDSVLKKHRTRPDIRIFYQILSDGNSHFDYRSTVNDSATLKLFCRLDSVLRNCSFCQIPESQGEAFGGWISLSELFQISDESVLSRDFFLRTMQLEKTKEGSKTKADTEHMAAPTF